MLFQHPLHASMSAEAAAESGLALLLLLCLLIIKTHLNELILDGGEHASHILTHREAALEDKSSFSALKILNPDCFPYIQKWLTVSCRCRTWEAK